MGAAHVRLMCGLVPTFTAEPTQEPLALSDSGLGVRVGIHIALPPPGECATRPHLRLSRGPSRRYL
eukprot:6245791-Prymnesium_polylepis.1